MSAGGQVEKPRFFVDLLQYQYEIGNIMNVAHQDSSNTDNRIDHELIGLKPIKKYSSAVNTHQWKSIMIGFKNPISIPTSDMFISCLGHKFADVNYKFVIGFVPVDEDYTPGLAWDSVDYINQWEYLDDICNSSGTTYNGIPEFNGWSIAKFTPADGGTQYGGGGTVQEDIGGVRILIVNQDFDTNNPVDWGWDLGGISVGMIYEPEFHADLAVTQSRIMDGVKNKKTKGGSTYSVVNYTKPADWWTGNPFELTSPGSTPQVGARLGRRSWDVAFSQLSDRFYTDGVPNGVFPANEMINKFNPDSVNGNYLSDQDYDSSSGMFNYNMENDNSLYSTLYHHTLGGTLPFIFSPSQDNSPQNFAICRFDKPGFKVTQKSYKKFNVKMKIHESW